MHTDSQQPDLNTRLKDAVTALGKKELTENIRNLFSEVCTEIIHRDLLGGDIKESKNNLMLMHSVAIGPNGTTPPAEHVDAFITECKKAVSILRENGEQTVSPLMAKMANGLDLFRQPAHLGKKEINLTSNKPVNKNTNELNWQ